jgi:hypothetical protein
MAVFCAAGKFTNGLNANKPALGRDVLVKPCGWNTNFQAVRSFYQRDGSRQTSR